MFSEQKFVWKALVVCHILFVLELRSVLFISLQYFPPTWFLALFLRTWVRLHLKKTADFVKWRNICENAVTLGFECVQSIATIFSINIVFDSVIFFCYVCGRARWHWKIRSARVKNVDRCASVSINDRCNDVLLKYKYVCQHTVKRVEKNIIVPYWEYQSILIDFVKRVYEIWQCIWTYVVIFGII